MGSRGMATVVYTESLKIFIDPGVSYAPKRYGLPPHPVELERFNEHLDFIHREISDSDIIVISHYHRDHYLYRRGEEEYYRRKILYVKNPVENINVSQRIRAHILLNKMKVCEIASRVMYADNSSDVIDKGLRIKFSSPVPHGADNTPLGYVVMTLIDIDGYRILHASDVQGPISLKALDFILENKPHLLIISGPPTYFEGYKIQSIEIEKSIDNLRQIITDLEELDTIVLDHHLLRDLEYRKRLGQVYDEARNYNVRIVTAAEFMGRPIEQLEALRKELWQKESH